MAPKQSKDVSNKKGYPEDDVDSPRDPLADSSTDYHSVDVGALIEKLQNLTLKDVMSMEKECADETRVLISKLQEMRKHIKSVNQKAKKEASAKKRLEANEEKKSLKEAERYIIKSFTVKCGNREVVVECKMSCTVGALRRKIGEALNMSINTSRKLALIVNGICISDSPRKTLLKLNMQHNKIIDAGVFTGNGEFVGLFAVPVEDDDDDDECTEEGSEPEGEA